MDLWAEFHRSDLSMRFKHCTLLEYIAPEYMHSDTENSRADNDKPIVGYRLLFHRRYNSAFSLHRIRSFTLVVRYKPLPKSIYFLFNTERRY